MTAAEAELVRELVAEGYSAPAIADYIERDPSTVLGLIRRRGMPYTPNTHGGRQRTPRIVNGELRVPADVRSRIVSAARRDGTIAAAAKAGGVDRATAEKVLEHDAPLVLRFRVRGGVPALGEVLRNTLGDVTRARDHLAGFGLMHDDEFDTLVIDYGEHEVRRLLDVASDDMRALHALRRQLRRALETTKGEP